MIALFLLLYYLKYLEASTRFQYRQSLIYKTISKSRLKLGAFSHKVIGEDGDRNTEPARGTRSTATVPDIPTVGSIEANYGPQDDGKKTFFP